MAGDYLPVAELFASLGLDMSQLTDGLAEARVRLSDINPEIISANNLLRELGHSGAATETEIAALTLALQDAFEANKAMESARRQALTDNKKVLAETALAQQEFYAEERAGIQNGIEAYKQHTAQVKASMAAEVAIQQEYAQLTKQFRGQEILQEQQLIAEKQAENVRYQAWWSRALREQEEATKVVYYNSGLASLGFDGEVTEQKILNQRRVAAASIEASEISYAGQRTVALESMAINKFLGTDVPWSMTRLVSSVPAVAAVMGSIFDIVLAGAFLDILYQVGSKIAEMTDDWNGFGEAARHAWAQAREGVNDTRKAALELRMLQIDQKYEENKTSSKKSDKAQWDELRDIEKKKVLQEDLNHRTEQLLTIRKSLDALDRGAEIRESLKSKGPLGSSLLAYTGEELKARLALYQSGLTEAEQRAEIEKELKQIQQESLDINKMGYTIDKDRTREIEKSASAHEKRRRDEVHELPYRLPWFMGVDPASAFAGQMNGMMTAGVNPSQVGRQSIRPVNMPPAPRQATSEQAFSQPQQSASSGRDVIMEVTYAPVFQVGILGDVDALMRDKIEPKFVKDMEDNARGLRAAVEAALRKSR